MVLASTALILILTLISVLGWIAEPLDNFLSLIPPLLVIGLSLLYQPRFVAVMTKPAERAPTLNNRFISLVKTYGISRRETGDHPSRLCGQNQQGDRG